MDFCVLIELSKKNISFLYNRSDGGSKFTPFVGDEHALPLAIYCLGNDIQIGQFAVEEAMSQSPYAFTDVFQVIRNVGTYKYKGAEYHYNTLLKNAIERYLSYFFDNTLIGQQGRLEQNIATMPLCFVFNADVDENERLFVKDCFEKGGYGNLATIDYDQVVVEASSFSTQYAVCVTSDGRDLFVSFYNAQTHQYLGSRVIRSKGMDPRVDIAVEKLWESLGYDNYYLNKEKEMPKLMQVAEDFLSSGDLELQESIQFSDGYMRECFLSMRELDNFRYSDDSKIVMDLKETLSKLSVSPLECTVVLRGKAANNGYFKRIFKDDFPSLVNVNESFRSKVLSQLLNDIKKDHYRFSKNIFSVRDIQEKPADKPSVVANTMVPSPTNKRYFKTKSAEIKGKIRIGDYPGAKEVSDLLLASLHQEGITLWDDEINSLIKDLPSDKPAERRPSVEPVSEAKQTSTKTDAKKYRRQVKIALAEANGKLRLGDSSGANTILLQMLDRLHRDGVNDFDKEICELQASVVTEARPVTAAKSPKPDLSHREKIQEEEKTSSRAESFLKAGKFAEAKKAYAAERNSDMAQVCSELIKSKRTISLYQSGLDAARRNRNKATIVAVVQDLDRIKRMYVKNGVDVSGVEKLINNYKSI